MIEMLAEATMAVILQHVNASNQHAVHRKLTQCYTSTTFQFKTRKSKTANPGEEGTISFPEWPLYQTQMPSFQPKKSQGIQRSRNVWPNQRENIINQQKLFL